ncbi:MAG: tRNA epoxyqueuosine(34) reductase QueG [Gammaproteobacteria bacterium]|nr:MAG: tRNA epoxyqueuosine(34) reductase QueG [Gammaproteobacteria bacterium]
MHAHVTKAEGPAVTMKALGQQIKDWGGSLGFQHVGITDTDLTQAEQHLQDWLARDCHGDMAYMARHGLKRSRPDQLLEHTLRVISVRLHYPACPDTEARLADGATAYISQYARGRDYHKLIRKRLQKLVALIQAEIGQGQYRVFCDSAPVLEKPLAEKAGLGWMGKHTNLISQRAGSWFFLGEIYTDLPLPIDAPESNHCGSCSACMDICPTQAIVAPYELDARRCISYLTIEHFGSIQETLRPMMGNRIYGCDDCQLVCPWNRFAVKSHEPDFRPRQQLDPRSLCDLFAWDENTFLKKTEGSAIRRIGHERWLRNIAVALGNAPGNAVTVNTLQRRARHPSALVREHAHWALDEQRKKS